MDQRNRSGLLIVLQAVAIVLLAWALVFYARDEWKIGTEEDKADIPARSRSVVREGRTLVRLAAAAQATNGIVTQRLQAVEAEGEASGYGLVVGLRPLLDLRARYLEARSQAAIARASLANTSAEYRRLQKLYQDDRNVSERAVSAAEAAWKGDEARVAAGEGAVGAALDAMRVQWGAVLAGWATDPASAEFAQLVSGKQALVQVTLPDPQGRGFIEPGVRVAPLGADVPLRKAEFVAPAPQGDPALQGQTFWYRSSGEGLRSGERLAVAVPGTLQRGVAVPGSAVVWYAGKAWIYVKSAADEFGRREISARSASGDGWIGDAALEGAEVVVSGAQLLLSEELKYQLKPDD